MIAFYANCVAIEEMDDFWLVGFADEKFDTRQYLMLQRSYKHDEQDIELGMNTYHVERDAQGFSCYGGIDRFELHRDHVLVRLTPPGAKQLKVKEIEIDFKIDSPLFKKLVQQLERVFEGTKCLTVPA